MALFADISQQNIDGIYRIVSTNKQIYIEDILLNLLRDARRKPKYGLYNVFQSIRRNGRSGRPIAPIHDCFSAIINVFCSVDRYSIRQFMEVNSPCRCFRKCLLLRFANPPACSLQFQPNNLVYPFPTYDYRTSLLSHTSGASEQPHS